MRNVKLAKGWSAAAVLSLAAGWCSAQSSAPSGSSHPDWSEIARSFAGEWEGQMQVRAANGSLSASLASMSARPGESGRSAELYYEGFAFGKPVDGAMVFSFDSDRASASIADQSVRLKATCQSGDEGSSADSFTLLGSSKAHHDDVKACFSRDGADAWTIEYQSQDKDGNWAPLFTMHMHRMEKGDRSAAADGFSNSPLLRGLREIQATASVDTDK